VGYDGGASALTVHRFLADPAAGGQPTPTRIHDILLERLAGLLGPHPRILDAGCGLGGTLLTLVDRLHGQGVGLTLSPSQQERAAAAARARGLGTRISIMVQSYDTPPPGPFDLIVAIESLAHSPAPALSTAALASVLAPGGCFVIVDDMPSSAAAGTEALARFQAGWHAPVLWTRTDYTHMFESRGLAVRVDDDLTPGMRVRSLRRIRRLERANRMLHRLLPWPGLRGVLDSYDGGLALERLYLDGAMEYRLMVGSRQ